jgi:hypothetical protein
MRRLLIGGCGAAALAVLLAACGGGHNALPPAAATSNGGSSSAKARTAVTFRIDVPKATTTAATKRRAQYVSPATTQLAISITDTSTGTAVTGYPTTVGLTPTSNGCSSTIATTQCQLAITLPAGSYTATLTTEDVNGTALSQASAVPFTIVAGTSNSVALTLSGIPTSIVVSSPSTTIRGSQLDGFTVYGTTARALLVNALDADGNIIVGPGAPSFSASVASGTGTWLPSATPAPTTPNTLAIQPPGTNGAAASVNITASYSDGTCSLTGAVCSASIRMTNDIQRLYVTQGSNAAVACYDLPFTGAAGACAFTPPSTSYPYYEQTGIAVGPNGQVYVAECNQGCNGASNPPDGFSVYDRSGNLIASKLDASGSHAVFNNPVAIAVDKNGNVAVANAGYYSQATFGSGANSVVLFAPGSSAPSQTIALPPGNAGQPYALAFDAAGDLIVATVTNVMQYATPLTSPTVAQTFGFGGQSFALDPLGTVFLGGPNGWSYAYPAAGGYGTTLFTVTPGSPRYALIEAAAFDPQENLYVGECGATCGNTYPHEALGVYPQTSWQSCSSAAPCYSGVTPPIEIAVSGRSDGIVVDAFGNVYDGLLSISNYQYYFSLDVFTAPVTNASTPQSIALAVPNATSALAISP